MDDPTLEDSPQDAAFRAEVRAFLDAHATLRHGTDRTTLLSTDTSLEAELHHIVACRDWQRTLFDHGWAGITWPTEYGGRGGTQQQAKIFAQEELRYEVTNNALSIGLQMVGPTLLDHAADDQKQRFLPPMLRGEDLWCQLFSEPGAGSDLAGLATRAELDGDEYVVNGQKVWTSSAHVADWGMMLARTDWDVPKHRGISYFLVDMRSPGIEVRPLRQITGFAHFNEVFLSDVRVPAANLVGGPGNGWRVAMTTLANERNMIGSGSGISFDSILELARRLGGAEDPVLRQELARSYTRFHLVAWLAGRARVRAQRGDHLGPEASVLKLLASQKVELDGDLVMALQGAGGMLRLEDAPFDGMWQSYFLNQWSVRIGGGTEQIQRNVLGERVLGLPAETREDKTLPFRDVPRN
ncbi:MAG: acyl-CoA dehydrogenase family protein [Actinomycetes bacterium]